MTERGRALHATADGQVAELIALVSSLDEAALRQVLASLVKHQGHQVQALRTALA